MRKRRGRLARLVTVFLALLVALGLTGMGYGIWSDTLTLSGTAETGTVSAELSCDGCSPAPGDTTWISCDVTGNVLDITITNAQVGTDYYCDFSIENTGTIPFKIQSIVVSPLPPAPGVEYEIQNVAVGDQIDPGDTEYGTVYVSLTPPEPPEPPDANPSQGDTFTFTVTGSVVQWNQYVQ